MVTYGFYNSLNGDRKYNALEMSRIFDGIIEDGIYANIGTALMVTASGEGMGIIVGIGRAWFNHTWTLNDAPLPLELEVPELIENRIDAVVLDINANNNYRKNEIKVVKGTPTTQTPSRPTMIKEENHWQYPLCYINVAAGSVIITQTNITNAVGTSETPFVTGVLESMSIDGIVAQWESKFMEWFVQLETELEGNPITNLQVQINRMNALRFATLSANGWTTNAPYTQVIPLIGYRDDDAPFIQCISPHQTKQEKNKIQKQWNFVDDINVTKNQLTATCNYDKPTINLLIAIKGR